MKVVINSCHTGFGVSEEILQKLCVNDPWDIQRDDPKFVSLVEKLGEEADSIHSNLKVVEIPDNISDWEIADYDGVENVIYVLNGMIHHRWW